MVSKTEQEIETLRNGAHVAYGILHAHLKPAHFLEGCLDAAAHNGVDLDEEARLRAEYKHRFRNYLGTEVGQEAEMDIEGAHTSLLRARRRLIRLANSAPASSTAPIAGGRLTVTAEEKETCENLIKEIDSVFTHPRTFLLELYPPQVGRLSPIEEEKALGRRGRARGEGSYRRELIYGGRRY